VGLKKIIIIIIIIMMMMITIIQIATYNIFLCKNTKQWKMFCQM